MLFSDVPQTSKFFIPAKYLKEQNLISGYNDGTFQPNNLVNRAEALAMVLKATGREIKTEESAHEKNITAENPIQINLPKSTDITIQDLKTGERMTLQKIKHLKIEVEEGSAKLKIIKPDSKKVFSDVSEKDWFYNIVREAKPLGIIKGYKGGVYFRPRSTVNLAEVLRMLFQSAGANTNAENAPLPPDIPADAWFSKDIAYAVRHYMLLQQQDGSVFPPDRQLTRGEIATLLYRFLQNKNNISFGYASWYADGLAKTKLTSGLEYKEKNLTAAHRDLPFGTIVEVINMGNGKKVQVVVNDRGPFVTGRIIDLSKTAFSALESSSAGIISVQIETLNPKP
ncbi:septal ring lytic transglycosylase RlpA family protein [Candidatus Peregrinibacteria bacterium]|nr:septal ring lytic transglycosylase RlpA family protein [Candidatus Peregrinibacteria bacterium]